MLKTVSLIGTPTRQHVRARSGEGTYALTGSRERLPNTVQGDSVAFGKGGNFDESTLKVPERAILHAVGEAKVATNPCCDQTRSSSASNLAETHVDPEAAEPMPVLGREISGRVRVKAGLAEVDNASHTTMVDVS